MVIVILVPLILLLMFFGHRAAQARVEKLKQNPDPFPLERLRQEPHGTETLITRDDGSQIRSIAAGSGQTVVLAHGYGVALGEWNIIFDRLVELGFRVIAFDQRGHGKSTIGSHGVGSQQMAGDYDAVLAHYDVHDAILVGHSMGGFLAIIFALNHPEVVTARLKGLVLFASLPGNALEGSPQNRIQIPLIRIGLIQRIIASDTYGTLFGESLYGDAPSFACIQAFRQIFGAQRHQPLIPIIEALANEDYTSRLGEIHLPTVVICGTKDKTTPPRHSEKLSKGLPNARWVQVPGKGHMINWEAPDALIEAVQTLKQ